MKNSRLSLALTIAALLFAGFGCFGKKPAPAPAVNESAATAPSSPGLPRQTQQQFDEDDHLDAALKDLETVQ